MPKRNLDVSKTGDHPAHPCEVKTQSLIPGAPNAISFVGWTKREHAALLILAATANNYQTFDTALAAAFTRADLFLAQCDRE
jgi:hypothetical protein